MLSGPTARRATHCAGSASSSSERLLRSSRRRASRTCSGEVVRHKAKASASAEEPSSHCTAYHCDKAWHALLTTGAPRAGPGAKTSLLDVAESTVRYRSRTTVILSTPTRAGAPEGSSRTRGRATSTARACWESGTSSPPRGGRSPVSSGTGESIPPPAPAPRSARSSLARDRRHGTRGQHLRSGIPAEAAALNQGVTPAW